MRWPCRWSCSAVLSVVGGLRRACRRARRRCQPLRARSWTARCRRRRPALGPPRAWLLQLGAAAAHRLSASRLRLASCYRAGRTPRSLATRPLAPRCTGSGSPAGASTGSTTALLVRPLRLARARQPRRLRRPLLPRYRRGRPRRIAAAQRDPDRPRALVCRAASAVGAVVADRDHGVAYDPGLAHRHAARRRPASAWPLALARPALAALDRAGRPGRRAWCWSLWLWSATAATWHRRRGAAWQIDPRPLDPAARHQLPPRPWTA